MRGARREQELTARALRLFAITAITVVLAATGEAAQGRGGQPQTPQAQSPIDLTGQWVSVVTEDWRWRMVTPPRGDVASLPVTDAARKEANAWDPARDVADGNACRAFGAGGVMRLPGRVRFSWQDPSTLKLETDAGTQTRLFHFDRSAVPGGERTWQGSSVAEWEVLGAGGRGGQAPQGGSLKVVTTSLRKGYVRKNGVPYSENATITEYFDRHRAPNGDEWFTVTTVIEDPVYFQGRFVTSTDFKKETDGSGWRPTPCVVDPPQASTTSQ